ncbi:hypothetical protein [Amycolatopsis sp. lyj-108]|uniref:hypothetical protein n=1 Tax=Amycolatopsis sp. lyj-108 TaxID=2789286 RepID=UPI00397A3D99
MGRAVASVVIVLGLVFAVTERGGRDKGVQSYPAPPTTPRLPSYSTAAPAPTTRPTRAVDSGCRLGQGPAEAQRKTGVAFPAELVAFLLRHDGVSGTGESFALPRSTTSRPRKPS